MRGATRSRSQWLNLSPKWHETVGLSGKRIGSLPPAAIKHEIMHILWNGFSEQKCSRGFWPHQLEVWGRLTITKDVGWLEKTT